MADYRRMTWAGMPDVRSRNKCKVHVNAHNREAECAGHGLQSACDGLY